MIQKRLELIEKSDIDALIANGVCEGRSLEYKQELPGQADGDRKEFLADISSFANAIGGDILFGIQEKRDAAGKPTGVPESAPGLSITNFDAQRLALEQVIQNGIDPRIPNVGVKFVDGFKKGPVLVVRLPKSWASPHVVSYKGHFKFYSRTSSGKYPLDVSELRAAFISSESVAEKIKIFRNDRIAKIIANDLPVRLDEGGIMVLHVLPIRAFSGTSQEDVLSLVKGRETNLAPLYGNHGHSFRYNFDGVLTCSKVDNQDTCFSYLQLFRNGVVETADSLVISKNDIPSVAYEREIMSCLRRLVTLEKDLGVYPPFFACLTVHGVQGRKMAVNPVKFVFAEHHPIDRDTLFLPEILIEDYDASPENLLRGAFDAFWQAAGWPRSMNYDKDGKWVGQG